MIPSAKLTKGNGVRAHRERRGFYPSRTFSSSCHAVADEVDQPLWKIVLKGDASVVLGSSPRSMPR